MFLATFRKELQLHLSDCKKRQRECAITGCHFWGDSHSLAQHNQTQAEKHVALLVEEKNKLQEALLNDVRILRCHCLTHFECKPQLTPSYQHAQSL